MTGDELRAWRTERALYRRDMVLLLGCSKRQFRMWEQGSRQIPEILAKLLRICGSSKAAMDQLMWLSLSPAMNWEGKYIAIRPRAHSG